MELIFKYNQTSFIRAQQIDRAIYNGLCFIGDDANLLI